jgi:putative ABC transport system permease protein
MYLRMVARSLLGRRSRLIVALLAVAIGAATLSGLVAVYRDVPRQLGWEFRSYGANLIVIPSGETSGLDPSVVEQVSGLLPADATVGVAPYRYDTVRINEQPFLAAGTEMSGAKAVSPYWGVTGAWPVASGDLLVGQDVADLIGLEAGEQVTVTGVGADGEDVARAFTVTGVLQSGGPEDRYVFTDLTDLAGLAGGSRIDVVEYSVATSEEQLAATAARITGTVEGAAAEPVKRVASSEASVLGTLQSLVYLVTLIVLVLTMICVSTTMIAVVAERRKEIGLRKALGADNRAIVAEFLGEGLLLGALGGLLGSVLGFGFAEVVSLNVFGRGISFQPLMILLTVVVSVAVTGLACLLPVRRAVDVEPAIVLRGE